LKRKTVFHVGKAKHKTMDKVLMNPLSGLEYKTSLMTAFK